MSAETVLNIIEEHNVEKLKHVIPDIAFDLIKKKYCKETQIPYLKQLIKKFEKKEKALNEKINEQN